MTSNAKVNAYSLEMSVLNSEGLSWSNFEAYLGLEDKSHFYV